MLVLVFSCSQKIRISAIISSLPLLETLILLQSLLRFKMASCGWYEFNLGIPRMLVVKFPSPFSIDKLILKHLNSCDCILTITNNQNSDWTIPFFLCGCGGLLHTTLQQWNATGFLVCNVFGLLFECGRGIFRHTPTWLHVELGGVWVWKHVSTFFFATRIQKQWKQQQPTGNSITH